MNNDRSDEQSAAARRPLDERRAPSQARARATREAILRAAGAEIELAGLDRLTTRRIAQAAGVSVGALYEYFPNKESIVNAMVEDWMENVLRAVEDLSPERSGPRDLLGYLNAQVDVIGRIYVSQPGLSGLVTMLTSVSGLRDAVRGHDERIVASVERALRVLVPNADPLDAAAMAKTMLLIGHEMMSEALVRKSPLAGRLIDNLKVCTFALASRLVMSVGRSPESRNIVSHEQ